MECSSCKKKKQTPLKRCKHFELGGDKKRKVGVFFACKFEIFLFYLGTNDSVLIYVQYFVLLIKISVKKLIKL